MTRVGPALPIIVVGAARSGTTMIREALGRHPDVGVLPYEVNYLWRYGNVGLPHDFLVPEEHMTPRIARYIASRLERLRAERAAPRLLDKTVANVVRLRYVQKVLPDARFIHVIRDGRAVSASAIKRWGVSQSPQYYASKARLIPLLDLPAYGWRYVRRQVRSKLSGLGHRQSWGVRFPGIEEMVSTESLARVCAAQWRWSVEAALEQAPKLDPDTYMEVRYETVVASPKESYRDMQRFLGLTPSGAVAEWVQRTADPARRERWREDLDADEFDEVMDEAGGLVRSLGYA